MDNRSIGSSPIPTFSFNPFGPIALVQQRRLGPRCKSWMRAKDREQGGQVSWILCPVRTWQGDF